MTRLPARSAGARVTAAAALVLAASAGCRSLLPRDDDTTLESIGKGVVWVPLCLVLVVADGIIEDETSVSPIDLAAGRCPSDADWDDERDRWAERILTERDLHPLTR